MKRCGKCKEYKLPTDFYNSKSSKDGRVNRCRACCKESRESNRESSRAWRKSHPNYQKEYGYAKRYAWMKKNKMKNRAHETARRYKAVLIKDACEMCKATNKLHMHHPDYSKPKEVITLCSQCHEDIHHGRKKLII